MGTIAMMKRLRLALASMILPRTYMIVRDFSAKITYLDLSPSDFRRIP